MARFARTKKLTLKLSLWPSGIEAVGRKLLGQDGGGGHDQRRRQSHFHDFLAGQEIGYSFRGRRWRDLGLGRNGGANQGGNEELVFHERGRRHLGFDLSIANTETFGKSFKKSF